jgi:predicted nucleic acid-binding protein
LSLFADTSVWSRAFRRDAPKPAPEVAALVDALNGRETIFVTGIVLQELLQGFASPKARRQIIERFLALPFLAPELQDHIDAAELRNRCRRAGIRVETVDVLIAQLSIRYDLTLLAMDRDYTHIAKHSTLRLWRSLA